MSKQFARTMLLLMALTGANGCSGHVNQAPNESEEAAIQAHDEAVQDSEMAHMLEEQKAAKEAKQKK